MTERDARQLLTLIASSVGGGGDERSSPRVEIVEVQADDSAATFVVKSHVGIFRLSMDANQLLPQQRLCLLVTGERYCEGLSFTTSSFNCDLRQMVDVSNRNDDLLISFPASVLDLLAR
jgi:hypothetical protein